MQTSIYVGEGPVEHEEEMPLMTEDNYAYRVRVWLKRWVDQIRNAYGEEPVGSYLKIKPNHHDFGVYYSVEYYYDDAVSEHADYAYRIEADPNGMLAEWDDVGGFDALAYPDWHKEFGQ